MSLEEHRQGVDDHCWHGDLEHIVAGTDQEERGWFVGVEVVRERGRGYQDWDQQGQYERKGEGLQGKGVEHVAVDNEGYDDTLKSIWPSAEEMQSSVCEGVRVGKQGGRERESEIEN